MPWKPVTPDDDAIARDIKTIAAELIEAKRMLNRRDPRELQIWARLDRAEVHLQGLSFIVR